MISHITTFRTYFDVISWYGLAFPGVLKDIGTISCWFFWGLCSVVQCFPFVVALWSLVLFPCAVGVAHLHKLKNKRGTQSRLSTAVKTLEREHWKKKKERKVAVQRVFSGIMYRPKCFIFAPGSFLFSDIIILLTYNLWMTSNLPNLTAWT